jgi:hypothetical protein
MTHCKQTHQKKKTKTKTKKRKKTLDVPAQPINRIINRRINQMEGLDPRFSLFLYNKEMTAPEP